MANTGVDVSWGRVTKAFEIIPVKGHPVKMSKITERVEVPVDMSSIGKPSWASPPVVNVAVEDSRGFTVDTLVKVPFHPHPLFFRILALDNSRNLLKLRLERFTLFWIRESVVIEQGATLMLGSGAHIYGAVDWVAMAMSADETQDLTRPEAWTYTEPLGNPASVRSREMAAMFDVAFRPDYVVRKSIIGFDHDYIKDYGSALDAGFGSLYWMEGVVIRLQDRRGSSGKLLVTMRVNNDLMCDLSALVALDDSALRPPQRPPPAEEGEDAAGDPAGGSNSGANSGTKRYSGRLAALSAKRSGSRGRRLAMGIAAQEAEPEGPAELPPQAPALEREFLRFRNTPGLAIGHPAILYDNVTDLYWMASNVNRDSTRVWRQPWQRDLPKLHITPFSKCEVDRTTMGLFFSGNAMDWWPAGVLDYHIDFAYHFTYPHMTIVGDDLLVVMRATAPVDEPTATSKWYNNHNSNSVSFHRVRGFRRLANVAWATYEGEYTLRPRMVSSEH